MSASGGWEGEEADPRPRPRVVAVVVASGLVVLVALLARGGVAPPEPALQVVTDPPREPEGALAGRPQADVAEDASAPGWAPMAAAPFSLSVAVPAAWTGAELVVWSGRSEQAGGIYDAGEDRWERLPPAPIERVTGWAAAWTGEEVVYWGGVGTGADRPVDGAAFAPARGTWRQVAAAPIDGRVGAAAVATPDAVIFWGGQHPRGTAVDGRVLSDGAAYDPASDAWSLLPAAELSPRADPVGVWTGTHVLVWGGRPGGRSPQAWLGDGALFEPSSGQWEPMEPAPVEFTFPPAVAWTGERLLVWGLPAEGLHLLSGWAFDVATRSWSPLPRLLNQERAHATAAWMPPATSAGATTSQPPLAVWGGLDRRLRTGRTDGFVLDPTTHLWRQIPPADLSPRLEPALVWTADRLLVWGGRWRARVFIDGAAYTP